MKCVVYTDEFEPITVIDVPREIERLFRERGRVLFPIWRDVGLFNPPLTAEAPEPLACAVRAEFVRRRGRETMFLFAEDEASALALRATLLPGQTAEVRQREDRAFARGLFRGIAFGMDGGGK